MEPSQRINMQFTSLYNAIYGTWHSSTGSVFNFSFENSGLAKIRRERLKIDVFQKSIMLVGSFLKFVFLLCNKLQFSRLSSTNVFFSFTNFEALFTKFTLFSLTIFTTCRKENCLDVNKLARPESLIRGYLEWQRLLRADYLLQVVNQVQIIILCVELGTYMSLHWFKICARNNVPSQCA